MRSTHGWHVLTRMLHCRKPTSLIPAGAADIWNHRCSTDRAPVREGRVEITQGCSGAHDPQHCLEKAPVVAPKRPGSPLSRGPAAPSGPVAHCSTHCGSRQASVFQPRIRFTVPRESGRENECQQVLIKFLYTEVFSERHLKILRHLVFSPIVHI